MADWFVTCRACRGTGRVGDWIDHGGQMRCVTVSCDACGGRGEIPQAVEEAHVLNSAHGKQDTNGGGK